MSWSVRRGGVELKSGRALIQASLFCLVAAGCTADPPPALLTIVDPESMTLQDSGLLNDSTKAAIRSYLGRIGHRGWNEAGDPAMDRLVGECRGITAMLNPRALPEAGRTTEVVVDVPGRGLTKFRVAQVKNDTAAAPTYTGQARSGEMSILLLRDTVVAGRINTSEGVYNFRSGPFGFISVDPPDASGVLPELHLIRTTAANMDPTGFRQGAQC